MAQGAPPGTQQGIRETNQNLGPPHWGTLCTPSSHPLDSSSRAWGVQSPEKSGLKNAEYGPGVPGGKAGYKTFDSLRLGLVNGKGPQKKSDRHPETGLSHT